MAPSAEVQAAFNAMKELGIPESRTKPVLKNLLKLYERNWKLIKEENYRALADAIFEDETEEVTEDKGIPDNLGVCPVGNVLEQEPLVQEEPEPPLKRLRRGGPPTPNVGPSTPDVGNALKQPKPEPVDEPQGLSAPQGPQSVPRKKKGKKPMTSSCQSEPPVRAARGAVQNSKGKEPAVNGLIIPKDEPCTDTVALNEVPLDVIRPDSLLEGPPSTANGSLLGQDSLQKASPGCADGINEPLGSLLSDEKEQNNLAITVVPEKSTANGEFSTSSLGEKESTDVSDTNHQSIVVFEQQQSNLDDDSTDITRGEERLKVSIVNESRREFVPSFHYIRQNIIYKDANVKSSFSQIGDGDCCQTCYGDCLSSSKQNECLCTKGGGFAYTSEGVLKEDLIEECIAKVRNPQNDDFVLCNTCPLEKCRNEGMLEPCKGHVKRTIIKECWVKCGCSKICANRVVQRGITCKLQVFWTPEEKGWGLRTLQELPKGAFVCEYVGEILTISERHKRSLQSKTNERHSFPLVLDSGWGCGDVQDNQSLCLDLTFYGNVSRFINHRCLDANLIEFPVQVEASDPYYYRIALFATRKIDAMEELTWDYGIEFDDQDKSSDDVFNCLCGSSFCRNMKRTSRSGRTISSAQ